MEHLKTSHNEAQTPQTPFTKLSSKNPKTLSDKALPQYADYLCDRLFGIIAPEEYRMKVLDLLEKTNKEIERRKK